MWRDKNDSLQSGSRARGRKHLAPSSITNILTALPIFPCMEGQPTQVVLVNIATKVYYLQEVVTDTWGIPVDHQTIVYPGILRLLHAHDILSNYGITRDSMLYVFPRP